MKVAKQKFTDLIVLFNKPGQIWEHLSAEDQSNLINIRFNTFKVTKEYMVDIRKQAKRLALTES